MRAPPAHLAIPLERVEQRVALLVSQLAQVKQAREPCRFMLLVASPRSITRMRGISAAALGAASGASAAALGAAGRGDDDGIL